MEILNAVIAAALMLTSLAVWRDGKICLSIAIGSAIGGANFWALSQIIARMLGEDSSKVKVAVFAFLKLAILVFILWAVIRWMPINVIAFLIGLSTIIISVVIASLRATAPCLPAGRKQSSVN